MGVVKSNATTKLGIRVITGTDKEDNAVFSNRTITGVNPKAEDAALLSVGKKLGELQENAVTGYIRTDSVYLADDGE